MDPVGPLSGRNRLHGRLRHGLALRRPSGGSLRTPLDHGSRSRRRRGRHRPDERRVRPVAAFPGVWPGVRPRQRWHVQPRRQCHDRPLVPRPARVGKQRGGVGQRHRTARHRRRVGTVIGSIRLACLLRRIGISNLVILAPLALAAVRSAPTRSVEQAHPVSGSTTDTPADIQLHPSPKILTTLGKSSGILICLSYRGKLCAILFGKTSIDEFMYFGKHFSVI